MRNLHNIFFVIALIFFFSYCFSISDASAYPGGIAGRTKKTTSSGCGNCHTFGSSTNAVINGPDTVIKGQYAQFSVTISKTTTGLGGIDIASLKGFLDTTGSMNYLRLLSGELVHKDGIIFSNSVTIYFRYRAPNYAATDTLFATANAGYQGKWNFAQEKIITVKQPNKIEYNGSIPVKFGLLQNYPNPFNSKTIINFSIGKSGNTSLKIYDITGKETKILINGFLPAGNHKLLLDCSSLSGGIYFLRLKSGEFSDCKKLSLVK